MNAVGGFQYVESLLRDFLQVVPFEASDPNGKMQPENVWSPRLATILQESCSQLDSCCRHELKRKNIAPGNRDHTMTDYQTHFGAWLAPRKLLFWQDENGEPVGIRPFREWSATARSLSWWQDYNSVKHDRIEHKKLGSLQNCVEALAGLFLVIVRLAATNTNVRQMVLSSGCWRITGSRIGEISEDNDNEIWRNFDRYNVVETKLFSFPLAWWNDHLAKQWLITSRNDPPAWGGFATINSPGAVSGTDKWKIWFANWAASLDSPFTQSSDFRPLIAAS